MKKITVVTVVIVVLLFAHWAWAGVSLVRNGSFENDGTEIGDIIVKAPMDWEDVNVPADKFGGKVNTDWSTHGYDDGDGNSLTLYSEALAMLNAGDTAMVSQKVYLEEGVNKIIFDLRLSSSSGTWGEVRSAVVLIDSNVVWDSNDYTPDSNDEYRNQQIDINDINGIGDTNLHTLSLAIRSNVTETQFPSFIEYRAHWDFVKFDVHCGGFGYLPEDLNWDCYVDMNDLEILAGQWLAKDPNYEYDLFKDESNIINFYDFGVLADRWGATTDWRDWAGDSFTEVGPDAGDLNGNGIINFEDFAIVAEGFDGDYSEVSLIADEWLERSWLYGL